MDEAPPFLKTATLADESVRCAGPVRWHNGVLQQLFVVQTYKNGWPGDDIREEWRDVPTS